MSTTTVQVLLSYGFPPNPYNTNDITTYLSQETGATLTSVIEKATDLCNFTAPEVSLKGYDRSNVIKNIFSGMGPTSTNWPVQIIGKVLGNQDVTFWGFVNPATLVFNQVEGSFGFSVLGLGRYLATTAANSLFLRTGPPNNYYDGKWSLTQPASPLSNVIRVVGVGSPPLCDFMTGDTIQLTGLATWVAGTKPSGTDQFSVLSVVPDPAGSNWFDLYLSGLPSNVVAAGTIVLLLTLYQRNLSLKSVVTQLFQAAGFSSVGSNFQVGALPNLGQMFLTPVNQSGITGSVQGVAPAPLLNVPIGVGTASGVFIAQDVSNGFTKVSGLPGNVPPDDVTNFAAVISSGTLYMGGAQRSITRSGTFRNGNLNWTVILYAYDYWSYIQTNQATRYRLTVTWSGDQPTPPYNYTTLLEKQVGAIGNGFSGWGTATTIWSGEASTTSSRFGAGTGFYIENLLGLAVDPRTGNVFFTDFTNGGTVGGPITMNLSTVTAGGVLTRNIASGVNGPIVVMCPTSAYTFLQIFQVDGFLGQGGQILTYVPGNGSATLQGQTPIPPWTVGTTLRFNGGDGFYYALAVDPTQGIIVLKFQIQANGTLAPQTPQTLGTDLISSAFGGCQLMVMQNQGAGTWPMVANLGGTLYYLGFQGSGLIAYADMGGAPQPVSGTSAPQVSSSALSVGDALAELAVYAAAVFYLDQTGSKWTFRTRSIPSGVPIGPNDQIDHIGTMTGLTTQPVFAQWIGYVSVQNENDDSIFGDTSDVAGSSAFANAIDQSLALNLQSRFVNTSTLAKAIAHSLYNYLGAQKRWIEVIVYRDGVTVYEVGRTFHCNVDGVNRMFQIMETQVAVFGIQVKLTAMEL
jgi:hypothetical protein